MNTQYFTDTGAAGESDRRALDLELRGHSVRMWVSDQVFSGSRVDLGTRQLLAEAPHAPAAGRFLDLGCGWGPLAIALGLEAPEAEVWAVDVNTRALDLTERNAKENGCGNVTVLRGEDALVQTRENSLTFDLIWSNPPVRIGKKAMREMLVDWLSLLSPEGAAYLVVQRNLGADSLIAWLNETGFPSGKIASKKGYRIIEVGARAQ